MYMRLWHIDMISVLPRQQLLGQHREICALRGLGWGKKHSTVNYVFNHTWEYLYYYHMLVIKEMKHREYKPNPTWSDFYYRGKREKKLDPNYIMKTNRKFKYPEHTADYRKECIINLKQKLDQAPPGRYNESEVYRFLDWSKKYIQL